MLAHRFCLKCLSLRIRPTASGRRVEGRVCLFKVGSGVERPLTDGTSECLLMADCGCSGSRNRRHFADVQDQILTGRFGASSSANRPSQHGHLPTYDRPRLRHPNDRFESTAAIGRRPLEGAHPPKRSLKGWRRRSTRGSGCTSAGQSAEQALLTLCFPSSRRPVRQQCSEVRRQPMKPTERPLASIQHHPIGRGKGPPAGSLRVGSARGNPVVHREFQRRQRQRALVKHDHVETADVEALAEFRLGAIAQFHDL
jgi:hypothetical protein